MNGVVAQFRKDYPAYAKTQVNVKWIPWTNATADWTNALASGKNAPDITELGNTETPTEASLGALANISSFVNAWSAKSDVVSGMLANDTQNGSVYGVPWFGGVRGIWYRTDQFKAAGITSPDLAAERQELGHRGFDRLRYPDHDQVLDERCPVCRNGQQGQHPAAERPQHRQRELAG